MSEPTSPGETASGPQSQDPDSPGASPSPADNPQSDEPTGETEVEPERLGPATFAEFGLADELLAGLADMEYAEPMPVQSAIWEAARTGRDVQVESQTGSGKTAAFGLPIIQRILEKGRSGLSSLILAPTRELARQVAVEISSLAEHTDVEVTAVYGGASMGPQITSLKGGADIVAGTPGRVLDHIRRRNLKTNGIDMLVLDECDEMLSMGFAEEIDAIIERLPPREDRQTLLFSATIPEDIERIAKRHLTDPVKLSLSGDHIAAREIDHYYYVVTGVARVRELVKVLLAENPESAIIFCNTRDDTGLVARYLGKNGFDAQAISSDLSQREREKVMAKMRAGNLRFLVATDVAARGIDISNLTHVINYQFPESPPVYVHRTGRTGRAGRTGTALSLVGARELGSFYYLKLTYQIYPEERDLPPSEELDKMLENNQFEKITKLVTETPNEKFLSLAKRVWESGEGERIVGALLERLLVREVNVERERVERQSERDRDGDDDDRGGRRRSRSRDRDRDRDRDDDRGGRGRRSRRRDRDDEAPKEKSAERPADDTKAPEGAVSEGDQAASTAEGDGESSGEGRKRKRRRRRRRRPDGDDTRRADRGDRSGDSGGSDGNDDKEFWETWAEDKQAQSNDSDDSDDDREDTDDGDDDDGSKTIRLYINIGKREDVSTDDIRDLIARFAGDAADQIGSIALRNTHCFVRVPEELVEPIIEASQGESFGEREIVVERAKR